MYIKYRCGKCGRTHETKALSFEYGLLLCNSCATPVSGDVKFIEGEIPGME